jgi:hypothetical protein
LSAWASNEEEITETKVVEGGREAEIDLSLLEHSTDHGIGSVVLDNEAAEPIESQVVI